MVLVKINVRLVSFSMIVVLNSRSLPIILQFSPTYVFLLSIVQKVIYYAQ